MSQPIKIAVVGPIPRDTISTYTNDIITRYGCVTHPVIALAKLLEKEGSVIPVTNIHKKDEEGIKKEFSPWPNIDTSGIDSTEDRGTVILLDFKDQNNREEKQLACMNPIMPKHVKNHLDADAFVFIPITDFEISASTLRYIKENSAATTIFDAHGVTTAMDVKGYRHRKFWIDRDEWLPYIDVLKMNLEESQCMWFANEYETHIPSIYDENDTAHLEALAEYVLDRGVSYFYVTMDSRGCILYQRKDGKTVKDWIASVPVDHVVDTTGCGDSFAGGLAYGFAKYKDPIKAGQIANVLGARRTQGKNWDVFKNAEETETIRKTVYEKKD